MKVVIPHATYRGGLPSDPKESKGNLCADEAGIGIGLRTAKRPAVAWSDVAEVSFVSDNVKRSRKGAALAVGVGALLLSSRKDVAQLLVTLTSGEVAVFEVDKVTGAQLRGKLATVLSAASVAVD